MLSFEDEEWLYSIKDHGTSLRFTKEKVFTA